MPLRTKEIIFILFLAFQPASGYAREPQALSMAARCANNSGCIFTGQDMSINIDIKNETVLDIGMQINYLQKIGPSFLFTDNETKSKEPLRLSLPPPPPEDGFETIRPGEIATITTRIRAKDMYMFRTEFVDLTVRLGFRAKLKITGQSDKTSFIGHSELRIIGKDTSERDN